LKVSFFVVLFKSFFFLFFFSLELQNDNNNSPLSNAA
jgi:hypothetical protein